METYELVVLIAMIATCLVLLWLIKRVYSKCKLPAGLDTYIMMFSKRNREISAKLLIKDTMGIRMFNTLNKPIRFNVISENKIAFIDDDGSPKNLAGWMLEDFLAHIERGEHPSKFDWRSRILAEKAEKRFDF